MLRDVPRIYVLFAFLGLSLAILVVFFVNNYQRGSDTLNLNEIVLSGVVTEVDHASRLYEGSLLLSDTFEVTVWESLEKHYPEGSVVQFDYMFDTKDPNFPDLNEDMVSSVPYRIGSDEPDLKSVTFTNRPIENVRVKIKEADDNVGNWTYVATIAVDAASKSENNQARNAN